MPYNIKTKQILDFVTMLFTVSCLSLAVWSIKIYRNTLIDWRILALIVIIGIVTFTIIFWHILLQVGYTIWAIVFISCTCGGCLSHFGFLYLNKTFADVETISDSFNIERTGELAKGRHGCGEPYAVINFNNLEKEIVFPCDFSGKIKEYSKIKILYSKGFLGFYVIKAKNLLK